MDPSAPKSHVQREAPDVDESRKALVAQVLSDVKRDKAKWAPAFTRMREDMSFVRKQLPNEQPKDDRAKVNIVQRHVNQRVATLYAKNPTFTATRRPQLDYAIWDGKRQSLQQAAEAVQAGAQTGLPMDPNTQALLEDVQQAVSRQQMIEKVGRSMEIVLGHALDEQMPPFKPQAKQAVRRTVVCGVSYLKVAYQRTLSKRPDTEARLADITDRLAAIERLTAGVQDGLIEDTSAEAEELKVAQAALSAEKDIIVREGLVLDFPRATAIIPDRNCVQIAVGFPGARRVTEEFCLDPKEVLETYGVDIGTSFMGYTFANGRYTESTDESRKAMVYETYDRTAGVLYVTCEGWADFLAEPGPPPLPYLEPFFPFFPLAFNQVEDEDDIYPESDVRLLRSIQIEINRKREAIRQHRWANRPLNVVRKGLLTESDAEALSTHEAHSVIQLEGLESGEDVEKAFKPFPKPGVDPNLYETSTDVSDIQMVVGAQEANLGGTSGDSATENSIAESSRMQSIASCVDDQDDWLSAIARASGQVLLHEMSAETAKKIAGLGTVWPVLKSQDIAEEVYLEVEAGSSGRPNKAQEIAGFERLMPYVLQLPNINPEWIARTAVKLLDPRVNLEEALTYGLPSVVSMNQQVQPGTGNPATDPNAQGGQGGANAPNPDQSSGGGQPSFQSDPQNGAPGFQ